MIAQEGDTKKVSALAYEKQTENVDKLLARWKKPA